jgi:hypothetical protein
MMELPYQLSSQDNDGWTVLAYNQAIYKDWNKLLERIPESLDLCLAYLSTQPMQRLAKRAFPLQGKKYKRAWEYRAAAGNRILYVPNPETKIVSVYYADKHPNPPTPKPPKDLLF